MARGDRAGVVRDPVRHRDQFLGIKDLIFGSPFIDSYHAYTPTFTALYGATTAAYPLSWRHRWRARRSGGTTSISSARYCLQWTIPGTMIAALFGAFAIDTTDATARMRRFSIAVVVVFCCALMIMVSDPGDGPHHALHLSVTLIPLALLAAGEQGSARWLTLDPQHVRHGRAARVRRAPRSCSRPRAGFKLVLAGPHSEAVEARRSSIQVAAALPHDAVVIVRLPLYPSRYARNDPFEGGVTYLSVPPETSADKVAVAYPGRRSIFVAHEGIPWTIERVR